jgi:hypothetical protein
MTGYEAMQCEPTERYAPPAESASESQRCALCGKAIAVDEKCYLPNDRPPGEEHFRTCSRVCNLRYDLIS